MFFTPAFADCFSLEFEWQQVSKTLLSIVDDLNNTVVWMVSTRPLISKSSCLCTNLLATEQRTTITIGITVTFTFHCFFSSLGRSTYLSLFSPSFSFYQWAAGTTKSTGSLFCWLSKGQIVGPKLSDPFVSQNPIEVCASHFPGRKLGCVHHLFV